MVGGTTDKNGYNQGNLTDNVLVTDKDGYVIFVYGGGRKQG